MATAPLIVVLYDRVFAFGSVKRAFEERGRFYAALAATWVVLAGVIWSAPVAIGAPNAKRLPISSVRLVNVREIARRGWAKRRIRPESR